MDKNKKKAEKTRKVLLVHLAFSYSFAKKDYGILKEHYTVKRIEWKGKRTIPKLIRGVLWADTTFSWFAGDHSSIIVFLSKIFGKSSIISVGGGDVASVPELEYGLFYNAGRKAKLIRYGIANADRVLVVDPSLKEDAIKNAEVSGENIEYLPTGYDVNYWKPCPPKENFVITTGVLSWTIVKRKGFDTFVKAAKSIPDTIFVIIGKHVDDSVDYLKSIAPDNVKFTGEVSDTELLKWYQRASVYTQISRYEGLPNALCEAMLCECVPVGTNYCGIPTAIGDTGFYTPFNNVDATASAIKKALAAKENGTLARKRILEKFPMQNRVNGIISTIEEVMDK